MALNLSRNTKVYFTTNLSAQKAVLSSGFTTANTFEIQVMDGYTFTQGTEQQTIQVNEAGATPNRGQRSFNTALNPVDWSISTYIRPKLTGGAVTAVEKYLWNALAGNQALKSPLSLASLTRSGLTATATTNTAAHGLAIGEAVTLTGVTEAGWNGTYIITDTPSADSFNLVYTSTPTGTTATTTLAFATGGQWVPDSTAYSMVHFANSNKHQLQSFGLIFKVDNVYYAVDNCAVDQAQIDFGIDAISMIAWSGKGTRVSEMTPTGFTATAADTSANFITNKLSTVTLASGIGGGGTAYTVPITGGSITLSNNLTYLTPQILGTVNTPIGYFTGARSISGTLNAYLRSGTVGGTSQLLNDILTASATSTENKYKVQIEVGGSTNPVKVELDCEAVQLQVPTVEVQDIVSTTINFTAQGYDGANYDIEKSNEAVVRYYSN